MLHTVFVMPLAGWAVLGRYAPYEVHSISAQPLTAEVAQIIRSNSLHLHWFGVRVTHKRELGKRVLSEDLFLGPKGVAALAVGKRALEQRDMLAS